MVKPFLMEGIEKCDEMMINLIDLLKERYNLANDRDVGRVIEKVESVMWG